MPQRHKGPRRFVAARLPVDVADALTVQADRDGLTLNDALHRAVVTWLDAPRSATDDAHNQGVTVT